MLAAVLTGMVIAAPPAAAQNSLRDNWAYALQPVQDTITVSGDPLFNQLMEETHAETDAVLFNDQWFLFHRRRMTPGAEKYAIAVSVSNNGTNFTWHHDVILPGLGQPWEGTNDGCGNVYAPKVLVQPNRLTMVFEADPHGPGCPEPTHNQVVAMSHSVDGLNWTWPKTVLFAQLPWEGKTAAGAHVGNVGTPTLVSHAGRIYVGYHGSSGQKLSRGYLVHNDNNPTDIRPAGGGGRSPDLDRESLQPSAFLRMNGQPESRPEFNTGFGAGDITTWHSGDGGTNDGGYYMVFEAFEGNVACGYPGRVTVAIARASTPAGPWTVQDIPIFPAHESSDGGQCGRDLPSWQFHDNTYKIITTQLDRHGIERWSLQNTYLNPVPPPPSAPDMWFVKTKQVASGQVEVHSATASSGYDDAVHAASYFSAADGPNGTWQMVGSDLWFIKTKQLTSGRIELHTATAASNYQSGIHVATHFAAAEANTGTWQVLNGDLYLIKTSQTDGTVEVHSATAASNYQSGVHHRTLFSAADRNNGTWQISANGDLYFIKTADVYSGRIEVHGATKSSAYIEPLISSTTWFSPIDGSNGWWQVIGRDLYFVKTQQTGGSVEVHTATFASGYQRASVHARTAYSAADGPNGWWQIGSRY